MSMRSTTSSSGRDSTTAVVSASTSGHGPSYASATTVPSNEPNASPRRRWSGAVSSRTPRSWSPAPVKAARHSQPATTSSTGRPSDRGEITVDEQEPRGGRDSFEPPATGFGEAYERSAVGCRDGGDQPFGRQALRSAGRDDGAAGRQEAGTGRPDRRPDGRRVQRRDQRGQGQQTGLDQGDRRVPSIRQHEPAVEKRPGGAELLPATPRAGSRREELVEQREARPPSVQVVVQHPDRDPEPAIELGGQRQQQGPQLAVAQPEDAGGRHQDIGEPTPVDDQVTIHVGQPASQLADGAVPEPETCEGVARRGGPPCERRLTGLLHPLQQPRTEDQLEPGHDRGKVGRRGVRGDRIGVDQVVGGRDVPRPRGPVSGAGRVDKVQACDRPRAGARGVRGAQLLDEPHQVLGAGVVDGDHRPSAGVVEEDDRHVLGPVQQVERPAQVGPLADDRRRGDH